MKDAVPSIMKCNALDFTRKHIRVNAVCPDAIVTPTIFDIYGNVSNEVLRDQPMGGVLADLMRLPPQPCGCAPMPRVLFLASRYRWMAASVFIVREVEALTFDTSNAAVRFVVLSSVGGAQRPREDKRDGQ